MKSVYPRGSESSLPASSPRVTIAVLTDLHYGLVSALPQRRGDIADILLLRAVHRLNRLIRPDVTLVLGDVVSDGSAPDAAQRLAGMRAILDKLDSPMIVIPGNHDGDPDAFYGAFARPGEWVDIGGVRFLPFVDQDEPGFNASRRPVDIERFRRARADWRGPIVALQHVCLAPPHLSEAPYTYLNAPEIIRAMAEAGVALSISGHHHPGAATVRNETTTFVTAPGLCEAPFPFLIVTLDGDTVTVERDQLAMLEHLGLVDTHIHTEFAYCGVNVSAGAVVALARDFGLAGVGFSEHSGQLYFSERRYWGGRWFSGGIADAPKRDNRMPAYLRLQEAYRRDGVAFGLEVDFDADGNPLLRPEHRGHFDHLIGAIHRLPGTSAAAPQLATLEREFMVMLERMLESGIAAVAHPFRVFRRAGFAPPERLFEPVADLLRKHRVAAEINFHNNQPPPEFVRLCLDRGVRLTLGSDAHNLHEVGEFADALKLLEAAGCSGSLSDVLAPLGKH